MADKMTDAKALAIVDRLVQLADDQPFEKYLTLDAKDARAHIAARRGGGEGVCPHEAWEEIGGARKCADCGEYITTPPARLAATAVRDADVYHLLRSIRYNANFGSQDRPASTRLSLIAADADRAIAALEAAVANQTED